MGKIPKLHDIWCYGAMEISILLLMWMTYLIFNLCLVATLMDGGEAFKCVNFGNHCQIELDYWVVSDPYIILSGLKSHS